MKNGFAIGFFFILSSFAFGDEGVLQFGGEAKLKSGLVFCREDHTLNQDKNGKPNLLRILYTGPDKKKWATLESHFLLSESLPNTQFEDFRDGYSYGFDYNSEKEEIQSWVLEGPNKQKVFKKIKAPPNTLVFQTAFLFIQKHLSELNAGERFNEKLFSPSKQDIFSVAIEKIKTETGTIAVKIEMASFILRQIMPKTTLTFELKSKKLLSYDGNSVLLDEKDRSQEVHIDFNDH